MPAGAVVLVLVAGLPIFWLLAAAFNPGAVGASALMARMLPVAIADTGVLMLEVGLGTALIGFGSAWLVTHFEFPGQRYLGWLLLLPLAVPTYLSAYSWIEFADYTGPLQKLVRALTGAQSVRDYWFPNLRTTHGAAFVMILVLYPYVYLSCRAFFLMQSGAMTAAARTLGSTRWQALMRVTLPLSRPAVVVGVTLALLEVVNDLGAVQYFGVNSLTAVIYATWLNRSNFAGAAQLAVSIVAIIALLIWLERHARRQRAYLGHRDTQTPPPRERLSGVAGFGAAAWCLAVVGLGFGVPFGQLAVLAAAKMMSGGMTPSFFPAFATTVLLGALGGIMCVLLGYYTAWQATSGAAGPQRPLIRLATLGYAIPGTVLALGLVGPLGLADSWLNSAGRSLFNWAPGLVLSGSVFAVLYAYAIRFLALSHQSLEAARLRRGNVVLDAAQVLGAHGWKLIWRIDLPTLTPAILSAATLVFVECVKELPATLLLRPLGVETLATLVYQQANASLFENAALPALAIIGAGLVPVLMAGSLSGGGTGFWQRQID